MRIMVVFLCLASQIIYAQEVPVSESAFIQNAEKIELSAPESASTLVLKTDDPNNRPRFEHMAYGYLVLGRQETFLTVQNLEPYERSQIDLAELAFEGEYHLSNTSKVEFEIEFEHGGTGTAIEFEPLEEFGEFEQEVEKGGEIVVSEATYEKSFRNGTELKAGKFPLFISLGSVLTKPTRFKAVQAFDLENRMIPYHWNEMGLQLEHKWKMATFRLATVNGLNSEFFRTYNWIGGGYQRHFESVNSDDMATLASIEIGSVVNGMGFAFSRYNGNTTHNRYKKNKLKDDAEVTLWSLMGALRMGRFGLVGEILRGHLQNSNLVSAANATLGGLAKPKTFAPLGEKADLSGVQLFYDLSDELSVFIQREQVNTFSEVAGNIAKNSRYDVERRSGGFMWIWEKGTFMKFQYAKEITALTGLPETYQANVALGFDLSVFE